VATRALHLAGGPFVRSSTMIRKPSSLRWVRAAAAGLLLAGPLAATSALAGGGVSWSIGIGVPGVVAYPAPVYAVPQPVYVRPAYPYGPPPSVWSPPVVVAPPPPVYYAPPPRWHGGPPGHWHGRGHGHGRGHWHGHGHGRGW
jgi:hypothetical protein